MCTNKILGSLEILAIKNCIKFSIDFIYRLNGTRGEGGGLTGLVKAPDTLFLKGLVLASTVFSNFSFNSITFEKNETENVTNLVISWQKVISSTLVQVVVRI